MKTLKRLILVCLLIGTFTLIDVFSNRSAHFSEGMITYFGFFIALHVFAIEAATSNNLFLKYSFAAAIFALIIYIFTKLPFVEAAISAVLMIVYSLALLAHFKPRITAVQKGQHESPPV